MLLGLRIRKPLQRDNAPQKEALRGMILTCIWCWGSSSRKPLHCHNFHFHFDLEWLYPMGQIDMFENYSYLDAIILRLPFNTLNDTLTSYPSPEVVVCIFSAISYRSSRWLESEKAKKRKKKKKKMVSVIGIKDGCHFSCLYLTNSYLISLVGSVRWLKPTYFCFKTWFHIIWCFFTVATRNAEKVISRRIGMAGHKKC